MSGSASASIAAEDHCSALYVMMMLKRCTNNLLFCELFSPCIWASPTSTSTVLTLLSSLAAMADRMILQQINPVGTALGGSLGRTRC